VIYECNDAPGQPTVNVGAPLNRAVPVGCTGILPSTTVSTTATGAFTVNFTIILGMTGPPCGSSYPVSCPVADSAGSNPVEDAAKYPCPPTPEQLAAGVSCQLAFGDAGGSSQTVSISFTSDSPPSATTAAASAGTAGTAGTPGASSAHTAANTLAFTGPGPGLWMLAIGGILLIDLGFLVLTIYYRPRQLFAIAGRKVHRMLGGT
jgi:hypothetical protein